MVCVLLSWSFEGDVLLFVLSTSVFCPAAGWAGQVQLCFSFKGIKDRGCGCSGAVETDPKLGRVVSVYVAWTACFIVMSAGTPAAAVNPDAVCVCLICPCADRTMRLLAWLLPAHW
jgi:hypothetical protein